VLRLGFIANFISKPVLIGFQAGIGVVIAVSQLKSVLGVHLVSQTTVGILCELSGALSRTHALTLYVAFAGVAVLLVLPRVTPRLSAPLVLVTVSALAATWFGLEARGVALVGAVPRGLPLIVCPDTSMLLHLWPAALGIALMSFTESVAAARTFIRRADPAINPARELVAIGAANLAAAFLGGFPAGGGTSQTAVNARAGARSQLAQLVTAGMVVVCLLFLSRGVSLLPQATLGALVLVVSASMVKPADFRAIGRVRKDELAWALVTTAGVVLIGTLEGILIAVAVSVLTLAYQFVHPPVYVMAHRPGTQIFCRLGDVPDDVTDPGLLILRTEGRIIFANAPYISDKMHALVDAHAPRVVVLECSAIPDIEYTALVMLTEAEERLRARGVELWLASLNPDLMWMMKRSPLENILGSHRIFRDLSEVQAAWKSRGLAAE